jgi:hypothetical protein
MGSWGYLIHTEGIRVKYKILKSFKIINTEAKSEVGKLAKGSFSGLVV